MWSTIVQYLMVKWQKPKLIHITMWNALYIISGSCWTKIVIALVFKNHSINSKAHENDKRKTKERAKHFMIIGKKLPITF
jgi:hypothetical protein